MSTIDDLGELLSECALHNGDDSTPLWVRDSTNKVESNKLSYPPSPLFTAEVNASAELCKRAEDNRLKFWADEAHELLWDNDFHEVLDWSNAPFAKWFVGGAINVSVNCIDRHVSAGNGSRIAVHWVGEPG